MTLDELTSLKELAAERERLLGLAEKVQTLPPDRLFHSALSVDMQEVARIGMAAELRRRAAACEADLRAKGILFPEPAPTLRPPTSWDPEAGEFTFRIASTGPERSERGLGYAGMIAVDQVILPRGLVNSRRPMPVLFCGGSRKATIGEVIRIWDEDGQILGRARLFPVASAARAAVACGAVADVGWMFDVCRERVTQREGLRPLVTVEEWNLEGVVLMSDDPDLGKLDPRDECPGKAKAA